MEIKISTQNLEVSDRFRDYVDSRLPKIEQLAHKAEALNIKIIRRDHSRGAGQEDQVELTVFSPGHVVRAEAHAADKFSAFDVAFGKLLERLRRLSDRRKVHHGRHGSEGTSELTATDFASLDIRPVSADLLVGQVAKDEPEAAEPDLGKSPVVIRRKTFTDEPMSVDDALYRMELVGHDFYLFHDSETGKPSVVYRRKGWNYGVLTLE